MRTTSGPAGEEREVVIDAAGTPPTGVLGFPPGAAGIAISGDGSGLVAGLAQRWFARLPAADRRAKRAEIAHRGHRARGGGV